MSGPLPFADRKNGSLAAGEGLLHARALTVGYDGVPILPALTLTVGAGELWAVIGPNGAGKSTFVRTALGLSRPVGGVLERRPGLRLAYVPQQSALDAIFPVSVLDFVLMGLQGTGNVTLASPGAYLGRARAVLAEAGVAGAGAPAAARSFGRAAAAGAHGAGAGDRRRFWSSSTSRPPRSTPPPSRRSSISSSGSATVGARPW